MKLGWFALPVGLFVAFGGGLYYYLNVAPVKAQSEFVAGEVRHPVTETMTKLTASFESKKIEQIVGTTTTKKTFTFAPDHSTKPQFLYFIKDGCPCSYDAEPLFKKLGLKYKDKVEFASVTDAQMDHAKSWDIAQTPPYPVVSDPDLKIIKHFGATNSVFSVLLDVNGRVLKMWPGYSKGILLEMNSLIAKAAGVPETKFDPGFAPNDKVSGCPFGESVPAKS